MNFSLNLSVSSWRQFKVQLIESALGFQDSGIQTVFLAVGYQFRPGGVQAVFIDDMDLCLYKQN